MQKKANLKGHALYSSISDPDPDPGVEMTHKNKKKLITFLSAVNFFNFFGHQNPGSGLDPDSMNPDPKQCSIE